jgi:hypothetical protein
MNRRSFFKTIAAGVAALAMPKKEYLKHKGSSMPCTMAETMKSVDMQATEVPQYQWKTVSYTINGDLGNATLRLFEKSKAEWMNRWQCNIDYYKGNQNAMWT